jgi:hypothetical protein
MRPFFTVLQDVQKGQLGIVRETTLLLYSIALSLHLEHYLEWGVIGIKKFPNTMIPTTPGKINAVKIHI